MDTVTIKMDFPKDVLLAADISEANASSDIKKHLALYMFKERIISFGKASKLSGLSKFEFIDSVYTRLSNDKQPDEDAPNCDRSKKRSRLFGISSGNSPPLLEL